jgi:prevent-host-death family protein
MSISNVHEAKTNLSQLIEAALRGEEVIIARRGVPAVKLVPAEAPKDKRTPLQKLEGLYAGQIPPQGDDWWQASDEMAELFEGSELFPRVPDQ